jgi:hypothetical protein
MDDPFLKAQIRIVPETDWMVAVIGLTLILYVISKLLFPRYHTRINHAFFNRHEAAKLIEEKNVLISKDGFLLNMVPLFCLAMLVYQQRGYFKPALIFNHPALHYLSTLAIVIIYFGGRVLLIHLFGYAIDQKKMALNFNQVWLLQFENLGSLILIPSLILPFTVGTVKMAILFILWIFVLAWVLYTIVRELDLLKSYKISIFYLFLYLCALEILPLWWALKSITEGW